MAKTLEELFQLPNMIETEDEYKNFVEELKLYADLNKAPLGKRFNDLNILIEAYEKKTKKDAEK